MSLTAVFAKSFFQLQDSCLTDCKCLLDKTQCCRTVLYVSIVIWVIFARHLSDSIKYFVSQNEILLILTDRPALREDFLNREHSERPDLVLCLSVSTGPEVIKLFSCAAQLRLKFILLIHVQMPTIVGFDDVNLKFISAILAFMSS